ncbi:MAG TPA: DUF6763 family protein [Gammaproteobacteria bacterium]|nr:DUF6763 family protein [Gammaproteobacteria bacterium]
MMNAQEPIVGNWYRQHDDSRQFQVVVVDKSKNSIRIQYPDDGTEELTFESWRQLELHPADAPEE